MVVPHNHEATLKFRFHKNFLLYSVFLLLAIFFVTVLSLITYQVKVVEKNKNLQKTEWLQEQIWLYNYYQHYVQKDFIDLQKNGKSFYLQVWPNEAYRFQEPISLQSFAETNSLGLQEKFAQLNKSVDFLIERESTYRKIPLGWPLRTGRVTSPFGRRISPFGYSIDFHTGTDFAAPTGTPIYATTDGVVTFSGTRHDGYGYQVRLEHAYGFITLYGHCSKVLVTAGQKIKRGDLIALVGMTGSATGPHVHYEVRLRQEDYLHPYEIFLNPWPFAKEHL